MQRIANCILLDQERNRVLLLNKPSRGWWVAPGGKMEQGETITETVIREYKEETGLILANPELKGVFTIMVEDHQRVVNEWMMFTFFATQFRGQLLEKSAEGELAWIPVHEALRLPRAEGDQYFFEHMLKSEQKGILIHTFYYDTEYRLLTYK